MKKFTNAFARRTTAVLLAFLSFVTLNVRGQTLFGWNVSNVNPSNAVPDGNDFGPSPLLATTLSTYIQGVGLTRGSGVKNTGAIGATRAWGGTSWLSSNKSQAIDSSDYVFFVLNANTGYRISLQSINPFDFRRSNSGATNGTVQYSLDGANFTDIVNVNYNDSSNGGGSIPLIDLSSISALQNIISTTSVTFRIVNWNNNILNAAGTWYIYDRSNNTNLDFAVNGTIAEVPSNWYRSVATGNWSTVSVWQSSPTSSGPWLPALAAPTPLASGVFLQSGYTVKLTSDQTVGGILNIDAGGVLDLNGYKLTMSSTSTLTGPPTGSFLTGSPTSSVVIAGTIDPVFKLWFTSATATENYLKDLIVSTTNTLYIGNAFNIAPTGSVKAMGPIVSNGSLTFKSDATGTARFDSSKANILGVTTVERYIPAKRAWRLLGSTIDSTGQTINDAWQEGGVNPSLAFGTYVNTAPKYGTQITNRDSMDIANGMDVNNTRNPSAKLLVGNTWVGLNSTKVPITNNLVYFLFVRGDRNNRLDLGTNAPTSTTTLRTKGRLYPSTGVDLPTTGVIGDYIAVPNVYASPTYIPSVLARSANIDATSYLIWDPGIYPFGGYIAKVIGGIAAPHTPNYSTDASPDTLQSGQGFIVVASGTNPTMMFREIDKVSRVSSTVFARPTAPIPALYVNLTSTDDAVLDGVGIALVSRQQKHPTIANTSNGYEDVYLADATGKLTIGARVLPTLRKIEVFNLEFNKLKEQDYKFSISAENISLEKFKLRLVDKYTKEETAILAKNGAYQFSVNIRDTNTYKNRFQLVLECIPTAEVEKNVKVYPNPVRDYFHIEGAGTLATVTIFTELGIPLLQTTVNDGIIDCSALPRGFYFAHIGTTKVVKILKQ